MELAGIEPARPGANPRRSTMKPEQGYQADGMRQCANLLQALEQVARRDAEGLGELDDGGQARLTLGAFEERNLSAVQAAARA